MAIKIYKVMSSERPMFREPFDEYITWDFSKNGKTRKLSFNNSKYASIVAIETDSYAECDREFHGQLSDGFFENLHFDYWEVCSECSQ